MTLPTREEAEEYLQQDLTGIDRIPHALLFARADEELMTRAEWEATIDYEAAGQAVKRRIGIGATPLVMAMQYAKVAVNAALGVGGETP